MVEVFQHQREFVNFGFVAVMPSLLGDVHYLQRMLSVLDWNHPAKAADIITLECACCLQCLDFRCLNVFEVIVMQWIFK